MRATLARELKTLADWIEDQGGMVGHIKAFLKEQGNSAMLSTTGEYVQIKETLNPKVTVNIAIIAFVSNDSQLCLKFAESLEKLYPVGIPSAI